VTGMTDDQIIAELRAEVVRLTGLLEVAQARIDLLERQARIDRSRPDAMRQFDEVRQDAMKNARRGVFPFDTGDGRGR
jgi:hypothetical protein